MTLKGCIIKINIILIIGNDKMARSQLLKDIVSGQVQIENILWRLKVIVGLF